MKTILHITNDFAGSVVYRNLISELDILGHKQIIYTAIRDKKRIGRNNLVFKNPESKIIYRDILNTSTDRAFFLLKIEKIFKDIKREVDLSQIDLIHAHTWYSDGVVAYKLFKEFGIPYICAIRNTDMNVFNKYVFYLDSLACKVLLNSSKIIFISKVYLERFKTLSVFRSNKSVLEAKLISIYNGVDEYWIENVKKKKNLIIDDDIFKILYVGKFDKGKNVSRLIDVINDLNLNNFKCELTLVGGGGNDDKNIMSKVNEQDSIKFLGEIRDKETLEKVFSKHHLFAMPSKAETFGLVYIEALSQGLPILNTINEGIHGIYCNIGESVRYNDGIGIKNAIIKIKENYQEYNFDSTSIVNLHSWKNIAISYSELYRKI